MTKPVRARARSTLAASWPPVGVALLGLLAWSLLARFAYGSQAYLFPSPLEVALAGARNLPLLLAAMAMTLVESVAGYLLAIIVGTTVAGLMSQSPTLRRGFYPYVVLLQTIPTIVVAPIIVLWFGYTIGSVVLISMLLALAPIINNTLTGLLSTSRNLLELFAMHRAGRWRTFRELRLPAALPSILAGLKTSAGLSVIGAIVGEFVIGSVGAHSGLGVQIIFAQGRLDTPLLFAEVIAASMLGLFVFQTVNLLGKRGLRHWHESEGD